MDLVDFVKENISNEEKESESIKLTISVSFLNQTKTITGNSYDEIMENVKEEFGIERFLLGTIEDNEDGMKDVVEYSEFNELEENKDKRFYILIKATGA